MPVKEGPVPPFPAGVDPDEYDRLRRRVLWTMPSGLYVVGSTDGVDRRNFMTLNWATQLAFEPKLLGIAVVQDALTHDLVDAGGGTTDSSGCRASRRASSRVRRARRRASFSATR